MVHDPFPRTDDEVLAATDVGTLLRHGLARDTSAPRSSATVRSRPPSPSTGSVCCRAR